MMDDIDDEDAFKLGVDRALADKSFLSLIFSVRTEGLFGNIKPESLSSYMSGLLIGSEVRVEILRHGIRPVGIVGDGTLSNLYKRALTHTGFTDVTIHDGDAASSAAGPMIKPELLAKWQDALKTLPLVAILRGIRPSEALDVGERLMAAGFKIVEVPLNSPDPFDSIKALVSAVGDRAIVGAGTVLTVADVETLKAVGGEICISPNSNPAVIRRAKELGLISFPAFFTPTEAFSAIEAGADALKLFQAELAGTTGLKAMKAVLPKTLPVFPVGG
eukprot:gene36090-46184_t